MANPLSVTQSEIRSEFKTKDGIYKNLRTHQLSKPRGQPLLGKELSETRVSIVSVKDMQGLSEWVVFNSGRELLCYPFHGTQQATDLAGPVDKHVYRSSYPIAHDINLCTRSTEQIDLIVGFNGGPLQHLNPLSRSCLGAYNADRDIDSSDVTCVKWVPGSETHFVSSHRSGRLYVWTTENSYRNIPTFSVHKQLKDTTIYVCKPKKSSPLVYRWDIGHGSVQHFEFSPDTDHIAVANQDGFLRIYNFTTQELYGRMRSYYGGFLCVCWSPDGKYVVTGGEDDLVSVWSFDEKQVLARGQGHKSYINKVAFDPYTSETDFSGSNYHLANELSSTSAAELKSQRSSRFFSEESRSYRVGSVGQDGLFCLWELSGDSLCLVRRLHGRSRSRTKPFPTIPLDESSDRDKEKKAEEEEVDGTERAKSLVLTEESMEESALTTSINSESSSKKSAEDKKNKTKKKQKKKKLKDVNNASTESVEMKSPVEQYPPTNDQTTTDESKNKKASAGEKHHKRFSVRKITKLINGSSSSRRVVSQFESCQSDDIAPSMQDINLIEPLVCKKIWTERLTDVMFRDDCLLVATQDGFVQVWGRPEFVMDSEVATNPAGLNSPRTDSSKHTSV